MRNLEAEKFCTPESVINALNEGKVLKDNVMPDFLGGTVILKVKSLYVVQATDVVNGTQTFAFPESQLAEILTDFSENGKLEFVEAEVDIPDEVMAKIETEVDGLAKRLAEKNKDA